MGHTLWCSEVNPDSALRNHSGGTICGAGEEPGSIVRKISASTAVPFLWLFAMSYQKLVPIFLLIPASSSFAPALSQWLILPSPKCSLILKPGCRGVGVEQCLQGPRAYSSLRVGVPVLSPSVFPFSLHLFSNSVPSALSADDSGPEIALFFSSLLI